MTKPEHPGFMVWNPNGRTPRYQHASLNAAKTEAKRPVQSEPGQPFYVLVPIGGAFLARPSAEEFSLPLFKNGATLDEEIPF